MKLSSVLAIGCAAVVAQQAAMADYYDADHYFVSPGGQPVPPPLSAIFDFRIGGDPTDPEPAGPPFSQLGYNPATETVTGIQLAINLLSGNPGQQNVTVNLDGIIINTFFTGSLLFGGTLSPADQASLIAAAQDGRVNYTINAADANSAFEVINARMDIKTAAKTGVPDAGATLAMLGFAVAGLGVARRKFNR